MRDPSRRAVLACVAGVSLAGCLDTGDESQDSPDSGTPETQTDGSPTATPTGESDTATDSSTPESTPTDSDSTAGDESTPEGESTPEETATATPTPDDEQSVHEDYEKTTVCVETSNGDRLGCVSAAIADTASLRYTGLSDTESLPEDSGMLFVFSDGDDRTFVMREMDFGLDIIYADDEGVITEIHHAPAPGPDEDGEEQRYPGRGQYVLEVNIGWTTARGVQEGDVLEIGAG